VVHHERVDDEAAFERLATTVYVAARTGEIDCGDAFDLAAAALRRNPLVPEATELASLSLECAGASRPRMAEVARRLLTAVDFSPGFSAEPEWLARLQEAMDLVNRDVAATGLPHRCRLRVGEPWFGGNARVETWDGHTDSGSGIFPVSGADPVSALVAVADDTQDAVMHSLWATWPECPVHRLGVHARDHDRTAVWWCPVEGGHPVTAIGEWPAR
jgi:hypothetical protein